MPQVNHLFQVSSLKFGREISAVVTDNADYQKVSQSKTNQNKLNLDEEINVIAVTESSQSGHISLRLTLADCTSLFFYPVFK